MTIRLADHFTYRKLLRFTLPSIIMMIFTSIYGVVDGFFISNFVGKTPFAAINLIMPFLMIFGAVGFMIGTGGCALVSLELGSGDKKQANKTFSLLVFTTIGAGIAVTVIGLTLLTPIAKALGADESMLPHCIAYGRIIIPALTMLMLQNVFQSFLIAAEKPNLGLIITVIAGVTNIVLDALFIVVFKWGVAGAAATTALSQCIGGLVPLIYFSLRNDSPLHLRKTAWDVGRLLKVCANGSSEFMTNISMSVVNICYNFQLMRLAGENGVAAYGVIMYVNFIFTSVFIGYSIGSAPIVSYHYGAQNYSELKNLLKKSLILMGIFGILQTALAEIAAQPLSSIFVGYDSDLLSMTTRGFMIFSLSFLIAGFNVYASAFFTALNDGAVSATISFLRTLLFQMAAVMLLPILLKLDGIWMSIVVAEVLALMVSITFWIKKKNTYHY